MGLITKEWIDAYHDQLLAVLDGKQPNLISGENIKTLNGISLLGSGNINFLSLVVADELPEASESTMNKIYLVPAEDTIAVDTRYEYITVEEDDEYRWELIGTFAFVIENYYNKSEIDAKLNGLTIAIDSDNRLIATKNNTRYFAQLTELITPANPTIPNDTKSVVTGNAVFNIVCSTQGAIIKYRRSASDNWTVGNSISVASGFSNETANVSKSLFVFLQSELNGEVSNNGNYFVYVIIEPKTAPCGLTIVRNGNNNDYSTQATITLTPSPSNGAVSYYSQDGGINWTEFNSAVELTSSTSQSAGKYRVKATRTSYVDSDIVQSTAFTLGKKKFYYGMGPATLVDEAAIMSLTGGGIQEKSTMAGTYNITTATIGKYIWFCGSGTLTSVTSGGFGVPMESVAVVDGYNCYRSTSAIQEIGTGEFKVV